MTGLLQVGNRIQGTDVHCVRTKTSDDTIRKSSFNRFYHQLQAFTFIIRRSTINFGKYQQEILEVRAENDATFWEKMIE